MEEHARVLSASCTHAQLYEVKRRMEPRLRSSVSKLAYADRREAGRERP